jgi:hypothetical protein
MQVLLSPWPIFCAYLLTAEVQDRQHVTLDKLHQTVQNQGLETLACRHHLADHDALRETVTHFGRGQQTVE